MTSETSASSRRPADALWPRIRYSGFDGVLVQFADELSEPANRAALALRARIEAEAWPGVAESSTSLVSTYLRFDPLRVSHSILHTKLTELVAGQDWYAAPLPRGRRRWTVPAVFGTELAPQLGEAAALAGLTAERAIEIIAEMPLRVQTIGFAPGQPYLGELPEAFDIPRQSNLSPSVPEGAVVVAIRQIVLFAVTTQTGWRHIGQSRFRCFRPEADAPFVLRPGDEVRFSPVSLETYHSLADQAPNGGAVSEDIG